MHQSVLIAPTIRSNVHRTKPQVHDDPYTPDPETRDLCNVTTELSNVAGALAFANHAVALTPGLSPVELKLKVQEVAKQFKTHSVLEAGIRTVLHYVQDAHPPSYELLLSMSVIGVTEMDPMLLDEVWKFQRQLATTKYYKLPYVVRLTENAPMPEDEAAEVVKARTQALEEALAFLRVTELMVLLLLPRFFASVSPLYVTHWSDCHDQH